MHSIFPEVKKNFGFGCMRLPLLEDGNVNYDEFSKMIKAYMDAGFNYFDTAHGYLKGKSEIALHDCLTTKYPRESYILANKLSPWFFEKEEDIRPLFESQLQICGVDYFDFYLMHAQDLEYYEKFKACRGYEQAREFKEEGKVRHLGFSFHDTAKVLDKILTENPYFEFVQIQFNYLDYESVDIQSRECMEVCRAHGKPVIIMEPVKGGALVNLPPEGQKIIDTLGGGSNASYAIRYAASFDPVFMVLSGMSNMEQMQDNLSFMQDFQKLTDAEMEALYKVRDHIRAQNLVSCTACRYCEDGCPKHIPIPDLFACLNMKKRGIAGYETKYAQVIKDRNKADACVSCGKCEESCPQKLQIRTLLRDVTKAFQ